MPNVKLRAFLVLFVCCFPYAANAQSGSPANQWTQLSPTGGPPDARQAQSSVFDLQTDSLIIFGGTGNDCEGNCNFNDVWSLSFGSSAQWTQISPSGTLPAARSGASAAYDSGNSQLMIFGGAGGIYSECENDAWVLSNANGINGAPAWIELNPGGTLPAARMGHSAVYDAASNRMIVFGGSTCFSEETPTFYNDAWILSNANGLSGTPTWTEVTFTGAVPPARVNHTAVYDPASNTMIIFGGENETGELNDVWVLSNANGVTGTPTWTQLSPAGTPPSPRAGSTATYDALTNRMTVFGGNDDENVFNDVWVLSGANGSAGTAVWTQLQPPAGNLPTARSELAAAFNPFTNQMVIFGGGDLDDDVFDDAWLLTNASGPMVVTSNTLSNGSVGLPYSANPSVRSGNTPYTWSVSTGSLPAGLTLNASTGAITGTPSSAGSFAFGLQVTDSSSPQQISIQNYAVTVSGSTAPNFQQYAIPTSDSAPSAIAPGPDGALWFTEMQGNNIGRISLSGVITEYAIPTSASEPEGIVAGPDGALWFTEFQGDQIGRITTTGGISEYPVGMTDPPTGITSGPDGALWFAEQNTFNFGRISTLGTATQFGLPVTQYYTPYNVVNTAAGPDGALWFTDYGNNEIGQITTSGVVTEFAIPTPNSAPTGIAAGPDGALWFTEAASGANKIGRITTSGVITEYSIPTPNSAPSSIVAGADGALWFAESGGGKIGRITTAGVITEFAVPGGNGPNAVAIGSDGALWFTSAANAVGRLSPVSALGLVCTVTGTPQVNAMYSAGCSASGGTNPYTYSVSAGTLPPGLVLNASNGTISGTPTSPGSYSFTLQASDNTSPGQVATYTVSNFFVQPTILALACSAPPSAQVGTTYSGSCTASGGTPTYAFSIGSGALPPGLSITSAGAITGTPTAAGTYSFTLQVTDSGAPTVQSVGQALSISVSAPITPPVMPTFSLCTPSTVSSVCTSLPATQTPAQPINLGMQLNQPTSVAINATLTLSFAADAADLPAGYMDPALQFVDSSGKQLGTSYNVTVPAATTNLTLPNIQPGTVAGAITVTLTVGGQQAAASTITVEPLAPVIEANSVQILNVTATGFDVEVVASSTPRDLTSATLTFTAAPGSKITSTTSFSVDLSSVLAQWYSSTEGQSYGSLFSLTVPFTFSGTVSAIQSVSVTLTNSIGTSSAVTGSQ